MRLRSRTAIRVAGLLRAHGRARRNRQIDMRAGHRLPVGSARRACPLLVYPTDRAAYSQALPDLLTAGKARPQPGKAHASCIGTMWWSMMRRPADRRLAARRGGTSRWRRICTACYRSIRRSGLSWRSPCTAGPAMPSGCTGWPNWPSPRKVATVVTGDVLYHVPERRMLQDVMGCIREGCTIDTAGHRLERFCRPPSAHTARNGRGSSPITRRRSPRTIEITERCRFSLAELHVISIPTKPNCPGETAQQALERHTWASAPTRYPNGHAARGRKTAANMNWQLIGQLRVRTLLPDREHHRSPSQEKWAFSARDAGRQPTWPSVSSLA